VTYIELQSMQFCPPMRMQSNRFAVKRSNLVRSSTTRP
jgi:hypothetical protein